MSHRLHSDGSGEADDFRFKTQTLDLWGLNLVAPLTARTIEGPGFSSLYVSILNRSTGHEQ